MGINPCKIYFILFQQAYIPVYKLPTRDMHIARNAVSIKKKTEEVSDDFTRQGLVCVKFIHLNPKNGQIMKQIGVKYFILFY